jgi:hypothetical protein
LLNEQNHDRRLRGGLCGVQGLCLSSHTGPAAVLLGGAIFSQKLRASRGATWAITNRKIIL